MNIIIINMPELLQLRVHSLNIQIITNYNVFINRLIFPVTPQQNV